MKVLCQDCLRLRSFTDDRHSGKERCFCGGEFCGCDACQYVGRLLRKGIRTADLLMTNFDIGRWSAKRGTKNNKGKDYDSDSY